jgi:hypothetical protein
VSKSPFQEKLVQWRQRHRFSLKLAASILEVPTGTYKNWGIRLYQPIYHLPQLPVKEN